MSLRNDAVGVLGVKILSHNLMRSALYFFVKPIWCTWFGPQYPFLLIHCLSEQLSVFLDKNKTFLIDFFKSSCSVSIRGRAGRNCRETYWWTLLLTYLIITLLNSFRPRATNTCCKNMHPSPERRSCAHRGFCLSSRVPRISVCRDSRSLPE